MSVAVWQYHKSPLHPRDGRRNRPWDLLRPVAFRYERYRSQSRSPLLQLPPEIRALIFEYALAEYINYEKPRAQPRPIKGCHPAYHAQLKYRINVHTAILRTCQKVYHEAWWIPLVTADLLLDISVMHPIELRRGTVLEVYHRRHALRLGVPGIEIDKARIIAPSALGGVAQALTLPHFYPRSVALLVRAIDIVGGGWTLKTPSRFISNTKLLLPASVNEVRFELETNEHMREDLILLSNLIRALWALDRTDGVRLVASATQRVPIYRWVPCERDMGPHLTKRDTPTYIGMATSLYPIDKGDPRSAIPLELPTLYSRGQPLVYSPPARSTGLPQGPCASMQYALSLAKQPLVSRDWQAPHPLPDLPVVRDCPSCKSTGAASKSSTSSSSPSPQQSPTPSLVVPVTVPSQPAASDSPAHAEVITAAPTADQGSCGGTVAYGTITTTELPPPVSAIRSDCKKAKLTWWKWVVIVSICIGCVVIACVQVL